MNRKLVAMMLIFGAPTAFAQDEEAIEAAPEETREVKYNERTEIDFEAVDVNGELVKPQEQLISERRKASFNPLIRLRTDFNDEMRSSVDEVK